MAKFGYTELFKSSGCLNVMSSDPDVVAWATIRTKKIFSDCRYAYYNDKSVTDIFGVGLSNLKGKDTEVRIQLFRELLEQGWEPFGACNFGWRFDSNGSNSFQLKKKYD